MAGEICLLCRTDHNSVHILIDFQRRGGGENSFWKGSVVSISRCAICCAVVYTPRIVLRVTFLLTNNY